MEKKNCNNENLWTRNCKNWLCATEQGKHVPVNSHSDLTEWITNHSFSSSSNRTVIKEQGGEFSLITNPDDMNQAFAEVFVTTKRQVVVITSQEQRRKSILRGKDIDRSCSKWTGQRDPYKTTNKGSQEF